MNVVDVWTDCSEFGGGGSVVLERDNRVTTGGNLSASNYSPTPIPSHLSVIRVISMVNRRRGYKSFLERANRLIIKQNGGEFWNFLLIGANQ